VVLVLIDVDRSIVVGRRREVRGKRGIDEALVVRADREDADIVDVRAVVGDRGRSGAVIAPLEVVGAGGEIHRREHPARRVCRHRLGRLLDAVDEDLEGIARDRGGELPAEGNLPGGRQVHALGERRVATRGDRARAGCETERVVSVAVLVLPAARHGVTSRQGQLGARRIGEPFGLGDGDEHVVDISLVVRSGSAGRALVAPFDFVRAGDEIERNERPVGVGLARQRGFLDAVHEDLELVARGEAAELHAPRKFGRGGVIERLLEARRGARRGRAHTCGPAAERRGVRGDGILKDPARARGGVTGGKSELRVRGVDKSLGPFDGGDNLVDVGLVVGRTSRSGPLIGPNDLVRTGGKAVQRHERPIRVGGERVRRTFDAVDEHLELVAHGGARQLPAEGHLTGLRHRHGLGHRSRLARGRGPRLRGEPAVAARVESDVVLALPSADGRVARGKSEDGIRGINHGLGEWIVGCVDEINKGLVLRPARRRAAAVEHPLHLVGAFVDCNRAVEPAGLRGIERRTKLAVHVQMQTVGRRNVLELPFELDRSGIRQRQRARHEGGCAGFDVARAGCETAGRERGRVLIHPVVGHETRRQRDLRPRRVEEGLGVEVVCDVDLIDEDLVVGRHGRRGAGAIVFPLELVGTLRKTGHRPLQPTRAVGSRERGLENAVHVEANPVVGVQVLHLDLERDRTGVVQREGLRHRRLRAARRRARARGEIVDVDRDRVLVHPTAGGGEGRRERKFRARGIREGFGAVGPDLNRVDEHLVVRGGSGGSRPVVLPFHCVLALGEVERLLDPSRAVGGGERRAENAVDVDVHLVVGVCVFHLPAELEGPRVRKVERARHRSFRGGGGGVRARGPTAVVVRNGVLVGPTRTGDRVGGG